MAVVYSTEDVHPRDGLAYWVEVVTQGFVKYDLTPDSGAAFRARVSSGTIGSLGICDYESDPHRSGRSAADIRQSESDEVFICLQLTTKAMNIQDERHTIIEPGGFFILDPRRPFTARLERRSRTVTVRVRRQELEARMGDPAAWACHALDGRGPVSGLAAGFLSMLPSRVDHLPDAAACKVADQALDLVTLAFATERDTHGFTLSSRRSVTLMLLKRSIEARLPDPDLKPAGAAAAAGISVRYANSLLAQEDTCLERYIIGRRLERCRRTLDDPAQAHRMIGEIAFSWGFADLSHFARRFKAAFGCTPGEYRRRGAQKRPH